MKKYLFLLLSGIFAACSSQLVDVTNLRTELIPNPQGINTSAPRLSWEINSNERNVKQTAYQILVASSLDKLNAGEGDLWDSKVVDSDASSFIAYGGKNLESRTQCYWKVKITTNKGESNWSKPASWSVGLLKQQDWQAKWVGLDKAAEDESIKGRTRLAARYLRKEFDETQKPVKATLYISGLGLYKLYVNGQKIGDQEMSPTPTDYSKVVKYNTFDITKAVVKGKNAIGTVLGNGRYFNMREMQYGFPKLILQLEIFYADGTHKTIISDDSWKITADGPIRANNEFDGEEYDATKELTGWDKTGYDDSKWQQAELVNAPGGQLEAQLNRNIKVMETIKPIGIQALKDTTYILDMGQNMVGRLSLKVTGKSGDKVKLRFAETLKDDGTLYMDNLRGAKVTDIYTLKGDSKAESWEPAFVYHGFRYVEISGFPGTPTVNDFEGKVMYDEMETTGSFETSDSTINQLHKNAYWGIRGNYRGMPTDCPQRDERQGWLGDRAVGSHGESFIFHNHSIYSKWLDDIDQSQREDGSIPDVAPKGWSIYSDNMTWPGAYVIIANMLYDQFGDKAPLIKHYDSMKKWMGYMREKYMQDTIIAKDTYGDWCMPPERPDLIHSQDPRRKTEGAVLSTSFYYRMLFLLERFANLQGKTDDAKAFAAEAATVKQAFNNKYFNEETARYSNNTVTANLLPLCYGMVPPGSESKIFDNIIDKTVTDFNSHVSTGLVGIQWLMRGLSDRGRADLAFLIATNRDYPSWGYMFENDATTIWELWNGNTADPGMNSQNHVMLLGDVVVWLYEYLAGIQSSAGSEGFKKITMKPYPVPGLDFVKASYHSVKGDIKSAWHKENTDFIWDITVPANSTATVYVPAKDKNQVKESGKEIIDSDEIKFVKTEGEYVVYEIGSGQYHFTGFVEKKEPLKRPGPMAPVVKKPLDLTIVNARYGNLSKAGEWVDVTAKVQELVAAGEDYIVADNNLAGKDPSYKKVKSLALTVRYSNGKEKKFEVTEGQGVDLLAK
jgi:alpha-L-rhamnosidase